MNDDQTDKLIEAIKDITGADSNRPQGLEGLGIALGGDRLSYPVGPAIQAVADNLGRIADAIESLTVALKTK